MIGIIGAMESEVLTLCNALEDKKEIKAGGYTFNQGKISGKDVVVVKSGIGKVNSALCAQLLILKFNADKLINTGIAGATGGNLGIFDFVVSTQTVYHDFDTTAFGYKIGQVPGMVERFPADKKLGELALTAFDKTEFSKEHKAVIGVIASGDQFISDSKQKKTIQVNFDPSCVEMEGAAIAHACYLNKIPFVIVRCMSDMADETVEQTYSFNEDICAAASACLVLKMIELAD